MGRPPKSAGNNYLRAWREFRGLTQEQLAEKVLTTAAVISLLESGSRPLSDKWLDRLAPVLGTTRGRLLDNHPDDATGDLFDAAADVPKDRRAEAAQVLRILTRR